MTIPGVGTIDISTAGMNVLLWVLVLSGITFFFTKYWPWYTKERWPRLQVQKEQRIAGDLEIEKRRNDVLSSINDNLIRLTTLVQANFRLLESHDSWTRDFSQELATFIKGDKSEL